MKHLILFLALIFVSMPALAQKKMSDTGYGQQNGFINGSFPFYQRGVTDGTSGYGLDRWFATAGTVTSITANLPGGAKYGASLSLSAASGYLCQRVEQMNALQYYGHTITISGYVRASAGSGALQIKIDRPNTIDSYGGVGKAGTTTTSEVAATNVLASTSTSLQRFTYTMAASANMANYGFQACLGNGSTTTTTYELSNIMLNTGDRAAPFALAGRTIGGEYNLATRYFERLLATQYVAFGTAHVEGSTSFYGTTRYAMKRATPTTITYGGTLQFNNSAIAGGTGNISSVTVYGKDAQSALLTGTVPSLTNTSGMFRCNTTNCYIDIDSEL